MSQFLFSQPAAAACWWPGAVCRMGARESLQPENAKSARNHPQQGRGAGKHNIGHHGKQLWRWMAGGGGGGGAGVGGGDLEEGSASARIALGCLAPHHLLLLLYTAPPVAHLSLGHPSSPESTCPAPNICHSCTNICLPTTRHICFHHIFVFLIYLSRQIPVTAQCFYLSHICFSEPGLFLVSFPGHRWRCLYILSDFISAKLWNHHIATALSPQQVRTRPIGLVRSRSTKAEIRF